MKKYFFGLFLSAGVCFSSLGQTEYDALIYSKNDILGSARFSSMGGAFTALGGDLSGTWYNPAGVAVFQSNEFSITPAYHENVTQTDYTGNQTLSGKGNLNISTLGIVGSQQLREMGKWRNASLAFGINRAYSYHKRYSVYGTGVRTSLLDLYTSEVNKAGVNWWEFASDDPPYPFDAYLAWYNFLIDTIPGYSNQYTHAGGALPFDQNLDVEIQGSKRETYFNAGANYDDRFYIGGGIHFTSINHSMNRVYSEYTNPADTTTLLDEFSEGYYESTTGSGISMTIGAIFRPTDQIRIGASVKTPEWIRLDTEFETDNVAIFNGTAYSVNSPYIGVYEYRVSTPARATLGVAYTFNKIGLISIEADYVDYSAITMRPVKSGNFNAENAAIKTYLDQAVNIRLGGEYRITQELAARLGYAYYDNPYRNSNTPGGFRVVSGGLGFRTDEFFVDLAYQLKQSNEQFNLVQNAANENVSLSEIDHRISVTVGLRF